MPIIASATAVLPAIFTSGFFVVLGQCIVWAINRKPQANRDERDASAEERAEEDADLTQQRAIANDALARERLAYERAIRAEDKLTLAESEVDRLRVIARESASQMSTLESAARSHADASAVARAEIDRYRRYVHLLEAELQRIGGNIPPASSGS